MIDLEAALTKEKEKVKKQKILITQYFNSKTNNTHNAEKIKVSRWRRLPLPSLQIGFCMACTCLCCNCYWRDIGKVRREVLEKTIECDLNAKSLCEMAGSLVVLRQYYVF